MPFYSPPRPFRSPDKKLTEEAALTYPANGASGKDTGFQRQEPPGVLTWQPRQKPEGQALTVAEVFLNAVLSSVPIGVEHTLAGVKRCHIVKDVVRHTKAGFTDVVLEVACALLNLWLPVAIPFLLSIYWLRLFNAYFQ